MLKAQVDHSSMRKFRCYVPDSGQSVYAVALGNLLKEGEIVVGDWVNLESSTVENEFLITRIFERKNEIFRILVRENRKKVVASNCDLLAIIVSVNKPQYKQGFLDRYLIRSFQWGIPCIVIFNKMDLGIDEMDPTFEAHRLTALQIPCFEVSAIQGKHYQPQFLSLGFNDLTQLLQNRSVLFVGQSGVGKSQLITALTDGQFQLKSREMGKVGKGTHTTSWSEIIRYPPLTMIDTPGIRSFSLEDFTAELLIDAFPDITFLAPLCQFGKCNHDTKAQGCIFYSDKLEEKLGEEWEKEVSDFLFEKLGSPLPFQKMSLSKKAKKELILSRLESYLHIYDELKKNQNWNNSFIKKS